MARLRIPPHVADKILNHQGGTISGVAAVYQRHDFLSERKDALERWGAHVEKITGAQPLNTANRPQMAALMPPINMNYLILRPPDFNTNQVHKPASSIV